MIAKQIIKEPNINYISDIDETSFYISYKNRSFSIDDINFNIDYKVASISLYEGYFNTEDSYLLSFSILSKNYEQKISVKLIDESWDVRDISKNEQFVNYIPITIPSEVEHEKYTFSFVFKPNFKKFNEIIFQSLGDYVVTDNDKRIVDIDDVKIQRINTENVLDFDELKKIKEFGIQAPPGFLFTINGEGFHMGRTGMFYLAEDDFVFESIGICDNTLPFIIDYKIEE